MKTEIDFKGALHSVEVKPGDRFVMRCSHPISNEQAAAIGNNWDAFAPDSPLFVLPEGFELSVVRESEEQSPEQIDPKTGRPFGDHGTALDAVKFATTNDGCISGEEYAFLNAWMVGDLREFPEFYEWLKKQ